jgi:hypothetical protein
MPINVTLGTYELEISDANGDLIDTIAYQSIDTIAYVNNPGTVVNSSTLGAAPTVTGDPQWSAVIWLRDGRKAFIMLGDVDNQAGWTNDQTGFDALVADIYAAFPAGGGGGGTGTVTTFSFTNTADVTGTVATATTTPALTITAVASTRKSISQAAHGFAVGDWLKRSSGSYAKAQANSAANAEVVGVVGTVTNANTFVLVTEGVVEGLSGLTDATTYFLSPTTAGALTATNPSTVGQVSKPVFIANSTVGGIFVNMRGMLITAPAALPFTEYRDYVAGFDGQPLSGYSYNSIGGSPAWVKTGTGVFEVTMTGLFNLTTYPQGWTSNNGVGPTMCSSILSSINVCRFEFYDITGAPADPSTFFISITKYGS